MLDSITYSLDTILLVGHRDVGRGDVLFRRDTVESFSKSAVHDRLYPIQGCEALTLAFALITSPPDPEKHLQRHAPSIVYPWMYLLMILYIYPGFYYLRFSFEHTIELFPLFPPCELGC